MGHVNTRVRVVKMEAGRGCLISRSWSDSHCEPSHMVLKTELWSFKKATSALSHRTEPPMVPNTGALVCILQHVDAMCLRLLLWLHWGYGLWGGRPQVMCHFLYSLPETMSASPGTSGHLLRSICTCANVFSLCTLWQEGISFCRQLLLPRGQVSTEMTHNSSEQICMSSAAQLCGMILLKSQECSRGCPGG